MCALFFFLLAIILFFFFTATATTEIYTLSLHDALPISFQDGNLYVIAVDKLIKYENAEANLDNLGQGKVVYDDMPSDRKSTRLNSSHTVISYAVFCLKKKKIIHTYSDCLHHSNATGDGI